MYLEGQLPYGPASSNVGAPAIPTMSDPGTPSTYTTPEGGPVVVSPSLATADGIVQTPDLTTKVPAQGLDTTSASYSQCGDYAADGSLTTIRERRIFEPACPIPGAGVSAAGIGLFAAAFVGLMLLTPKRSR